MVISGGIPNSLSPILAAIENGNESKQSKKIGDKMFFEELRG